MLSTTLVDRYVDLLLTGDRRKCRQFVQQQATEARLEVTSLYYELLWPTMQKIDKLYRSDRINTAAEHMATRINRSIADQLQANLVQMPAIGKKILITCADGEPEELGAQMCADLFEARGWEVIFLGGGVPNDEILYIVGQARPDILLIFGTQPVGVPQVRAVIDMIRNVAANPTMNIMISGGVFNRAEGLWKEVNADLFAKSATEAIAIAESAQPRKAEFRITGVPKKRRRRRRTLATTGAPN